MQNATKTRDREDKIKQQCRKRHKNNCNTKPKPQKKRPWISRVLKTIGRETRWAYPNNPEPYTWQQTKSKVSDKTTSEWTAHDWLLTGLLVIQRIDSELEAKSITKAQWFVEHSFRCCGWGAPVCLVCWHCNCTQTDDVAKTCRTFP